MSTRSVVAYPVDGGFKGRYIHSDGYPEWVGKQLWALCQRDGVAGALDVLTEQHYGWSSLNVNTSAESPNSLYVRSEVVPGYGVAYTTAQGQSSPEEWVESWGDDWGTEYAYILDNQFQRITVLENTGLARPAGAWRIMAVLSLADPEPVWAELETATS